MKIVKTAFILTLLIGLFFHLPLGFAEKESGRKGTILLEAGGGFTGSPEGSLLGIDGFFFITPSVAVGPLVQFNLAETFTNYGVTAAVRYYFFTTRLNGRKFHVFFEGGGGFVVADPDGTDSDTSYLFHGGGGAELEIHKNISVHTVARANLNNAWGDQVSFAWRLLGITFWFN